LRQASEVEAGWVTGWLPKWQPRGPRALGVGRRRVGLARRGTEKHW